MTPPIEISSRSSNTAAWPHNSFRVLWRVLALPLGLLLAMLEPFVRTVVMALVLLSVFLAFFFEFSGAAPRFPFWGMLGFAGGLTAGLFVYYLCLRGLTRA